MVDPEPTERLRAVRETLRSQAVPIITRRLRVSEDTLREVAGWAEKDMLGALGAVEPGQVGWALVSAGAILARSAEDLVAPIAGSPDEALASGVMWAAVVTAAAGDALLGERGAQADRSGAGGIDLPSDAADRMRALGKALTGEMLGALASPQASRAFGADVVAELLDGLPALDHEQCGWALTTLGVWCARNSDALAPSRRRGLIRGRPGYDPARLALGCALAGALLASVGSTLIGEADA